ncbi:phage holin family protein [Phocea massiliensis]|uniref:phage holin family protein n=1 Tax=Merdimmobilis hominis TaxID=2897707 RepID=UPI001E4C4EC6|nr:phage holin family protein [Merdimmobilis hominis]MCD4835682.1 phage holin family protein [Merdimmobilis hominis]
MYLGINNYGSFGLRVSSCFAAAGTALNWLLGGWDLMVQALIAFMALDFVLGFAASVKNHTTDSQVMFWGGVNKVLVLGLVGVGVLLDSLLGVGEPYIRTAVIWFYIARELLSILENYGKLGNNIPPILKTVLAQLQEKGDITHE